MSEIAIRHCDSVEEFELCVKLQKEVWGFDDIEVVPLRMFVVATKIGGQVIGAFDRGQLIGFALSIPGTRSGHQYLHSHMLAVREDHRNTGIGRRIKLAQRDDALQRGFDLIEWTFDPLEIKNAFLNLERLGAICRRYNINQYGTSNSPLWGGLPTDRLIAEWWIRSRRVESLVNGGQLPHLEPERTISVPAEIYEWKAKAETRGKAADVQSRNRERFLAAFREGMAVLRFQRSPRGDGSYLLGHWDEDWSYAADH
ncbi:MAG TPA: GNAT family N-acetyltransferase [Terriglobales bacterium]|nr:GNAT family N-acetyltransferase [Terriglobales bacterium]